MSISFNVPAPNHSNPPITPHPHSSAPVDFNPKRGDDAPPELGTALCLSGGGYRAMLFHLGSLWRLNELGWLPTLNRVSSVSGGSITAGMLALAWPRLAFDASGVAQQFVPEVVDPIRRLAGKTIDVWAILCGLFSMGSIGEKVAAAYDHNLFHGATLQDLPDEVPGKAPRFVLNASNLQSGALFRFSKPYIWDWRVGKIPNPIISLATAVASSSAFPPVLAPMRLRFEDSDYAPNTGADLQRAPYTTHPVLADGGVYDNMGIETAWKRYRTVLVSNAGQKTLASPHVYSNWLRLTIRIESLIYNQVGSLRTRQVVDAYTLPRNQGNLWRDGTYWGIGSNIANYDLPDALPFPYKKSLQLAAVPTRLAAMKSVTQEQLINWGYAICDAAMRRWVVPDATSKPVFPYPLRLDNFS